MDIHPIIGMLIVVIIFTGAGIIYGKCMNRIGNLIYRLIQRMRNTIK